ncbi:beta-galactosidase [Neorhodopirellula lusitana]|uniref:Beta-galactosidase n=1 Tax=Neorhodopirellula lusitana TaxID=445327 RepID=A0ABY1QQI7_9BACT|nr:glycoside hydrolase family 2 TIM barrel-domain containing protein [Neorhodopirellula lusitana]SMP74847.1 beta-galactosidase [Neorhodopirellula lusitana]
MLKNSVTVTSLCLSLLILGGGVLSAAEDSSILGRHSFNEAWKFHNGDVDGAEMASHDDSEWRSLDLPHDWAIEGPFDVKYNARCGGLPFHGTGWYRKTFDVPTASAGKKVLLTFDGAMYNAHVWINGHFLGNRPFGYIEFQYDVSEYVKPGESNVVAVKLAPEDLSSRWYPGAGIYRSVWIDYRNPVHVTHWGTVITTPEVDQDEASVSVSTTLDGVADGNTATVQYTVLNQDGDVVATDKVKSSAAGVTAAKLQVAKPQLWDTEEPNLYTLQTKVFVGDQVTDSVEARFGIRTIEFSKDKGFFLNGTHTRIQGVCLHHDNGPLGAIANRRAIQRKLEIMKAMGVNSVRTSHNPPSNELLELCDEMGILVQVEAFDVWKKPKVENGYNKYFEEWSERDIKDMVRRDRNHPSVFMWSIGNEILEQHSAKDGNRIAKQLNDYVKEIDTTRPTTCGFNWWPMPYKTGMAGQVDIAGMNYKPLSYGDPVNEYLPDTPVVGSETSSCTSSRGVYHLPIEKYQTHPSKQVTSYDIIGPPWAYPPDIEFDALEEHPEVLGEYMWTGFDYLGEPTPYGGKDNSTNGYWNADWPSRSSYFGAVDLCGFPKDRFYLYQSQWTSDPMVHVLPHWNWEGEGHDVIPVFAYTNCDEVELFVNGESQGRKVKGKDLTKLPIKFNNYESDHMLSKYRLSWDVPYQPGSLRVVGYVDGQAVAEKEIQTAGEPAKIELVPDRKTINADGSDLVYVTVKITDAEGNFCPLASNEVHFTVDGPGTIAAVGNGNAATTAPFIADKREAFNGLCMLIIKAGKQPGEIAIQASSEGLAKATTAVNVKKH